jgi:inner membrane protein
MDSVTHIVVGAVVGEALAGKVLGKRAMLFGALAHSLPDVDIVSSLFASPAENLLIHRGITHSFGFALAATLLLAWLFNYWYRLSTMPFLKWTIFWAVEILLHIFLDTCNTYGTGWLEPFSHHRYSFNTLFVADPLFTLWPLIALLVLWRKPITDAARFTWVRVGIFGFLVYVSWATIAKQIIDQKVKRTVVSKNITVNEFITTPTMLNTLLWLVLVKSEYGVYVGYSSVFDSDDPVELTFFPYQNELLPLRSSKEQLLTFSQGYYHVNEVNGRVMFYDLRFGQTQGWVDVYSPFVFMFDLSDTNENLMTLQRGRFSGWSTHSVYMLWRRMWGIRKS